MSLPGGTESEWENTQTFSGFGTDNFGHEMVISWTDKNRKEGKLLKYNRLTRTLDVIREGSMNFDLLIALSSRFAFDQEPQEDSTFVPLVRDLVAGTELQRFSLEEYSEDFDILDPNPTEYLVFTDVIQALLPCKKSICVIPKEVTGVIARFL